MSISTPQTGGNRRPSSKPAAGGKPTGGRSAANDPAAKGGPAKGSAKGGSARTTSSGDAKARSSAPTSTKAGGKGAGGRPGTGPRAGKGGGRPPVTPVTIGHSRNWGVVALFTVVVLVAAGIIGFAVYEVHKSGLSWQDKADGIPGIVDYRKKDPGMLTRNHKYGHLTYKVNPPVGGDHNPNWERCMGDVYTAQIPNENAVHALEHGAVWITYQPDLPADQVNLLKSKVQGNDFMLMSPYPGLDKPISLQAWGFQLKVDKASDKRIDDFIKDLRVNAAVEPNTPCSTGSYVTGTGSTPFDLGKTGPSASAPGMN